MDVPDERYMVITVEADMGEPDVGHLPEDERQAIRDLYAGRHRLRVLVVDRKAEIWQWLDEEGQPSAWHYCDTDEPLQGFDELTQRLPLELL